MIILLYLSSIKVSLSLVMPAITMSLKLACKIKNSVVVIKSVIVLIKRRVVIVG